MKYKKKSFGKNFLNKLNDWGYDFRKWKISRSMYLEFLNIIKELEFSKYVFQDIFVEHEDMWSEWTLGKDVEWKNGLLIGEIPQFDIRKLDENEYYYYWRTYITYGLSNDNRMYVERGIALQSEIIQNRRCSRDKFVFYRNKLICNGTIQYNYLLDYHDMLWSEYTVSTFPFKLAQDCSYSDTVDDFKNVSMQSLLPIYQDIRRECKDLYSMRWNLDKILYNTDGNILQPNNMKVSIGKKIINIHLN